ncbi:MAG: alpha/beta hydrolase [Actinomycetota bacterium]
MELQPLDQAPDWFRRALGVPFEDRTVTVEGASIHYLAWGTPGAPGLVFVHGGGAHAHWWTHVAAEFADRYRIAAVDLSGHGDSDHRDAYSMEIWAAEVMAVADGLGCSGNPVVVGHSMGGFVAIATGALHGHRLAGVVVCDSPVSEPDPEVNAARSGEAFGKPRIYEDVETALARFRTVPEQERYLPYVMDHVARGSLRPVDGGHVWKFDRHVFDAIGHPRDVARPFLAQVQCRLALLASENGLVTPEVGRYMYDQLGRVAPVIELPQAGHHPMLDVPLILLTAIRTLLADWEHSVPFSRD